MYVETSGSLISTYFNHLRSQFHNEILQFTAFTCLVIWMGTGHAEIIILPCFKNKNIFEISKNFYTLFSKIEQYENTFPPNFYALVVSSSNMAEITAPNPKPRPKWLVLEIFHPLNSGLKSWCQKTQGEWAYEHQPPSARLSQIMSEEEALRRNQLIALNPAVLSIIQLTKRKDSHESITLRNAMDQDGPVKSQNNSQEWLNKSLTASQGERWTGIFDYSEKDVSKLLNITEKVGNIGLNQRTIPTEKRNCFHAISRDDCGLQSVFLEW